MKKRLFEQYAGEEGILGHDKEVSLYTNQQSPSSTTQMGDRSLATTPPITPRSIYNARDYIKPRITTNWEVETIAEYYSQKYPERGRIIPIFFNRNELDSVELVAANMIENFGDKYPVKIPTKIIFTSYSEPFTPFHSHPFILTKNKLISMRVDGEDTEKHEALAIHLGVQLVRPKRTNSSPQGDRFSCHLIAAGILKDLNEEDIKSVCDFDEGYTPLPKSLKYSQSISHLEEMLEENDRETPVKSDGTTLREYIEKHRPINENRSSLSPNKIDKTRITTKGQKMIAQMSTFSSFSEPTPSISPREAAAEMLKKRKAKSLNNELS